MLQERTELLLKAIFSEKPNSISIDCWSASKCIIHIPDINDPTCSSLYKNGGCLEIVRISCPEMLLVPAIPILFGHIYYAYIKNDSRYSNHYPQFSQYICYNDQLCDEFLANTTLISFNNATCRAPLDFLLKYEMTGSISWVHSCVAPYYKQLYKCNTIVRNDSTFCKTSNMYQWLNSSKFISKYRIFMMVLQIVNIMMMKILIHSIISIQFKVLKNSLNVQWRINIFLAIVLEMVSVIVVKMTISCAMMSGQMIIILKNIFHFRQFVMVSLN